MALSGSSQALMKLFPPQYDPSYLNHGNSDSRTSICVNQLEPDITTLNDPWMPIMTSAFGQASATVDWNHSFQTLSDTGNNPHYRHHSIIQHNHCPPIVSSLEAHMDAPEIAMTSLANKRSEPSPSASPTSTKSTDYGYRNAEGFLVCSFRGCTSRAVFSRGCDLRKHYKRHNKSHFCSFEECPQHYEGGFSSKKDLARHEAKHNPGVWCEWEGCDRLFSRVDNMVCLNEHMTDFVLIYRTQKDHLRRIHLKEKKATATPLSSQENFSRNDQRAFNQTKSVRK